MDHYTQWNTSRDGLVSAIVTLGFPEELGDAIARHLGSPKAVDRICFPQKNLLSEESE